MINKIVLRLKNKKNSFTVVIILTYIILAFVVTTIWFKNKELFATAEEGMPFYNSQRAAHLYSNIIYDNGTGNLEPLLLTRAPLYYLSSLLERFIPNYVVQQVVFILIIITATYGVFELGKELGFTKNASFISGSFYFLNLYSMTQVWRRSMYTGIFTWAFIPIFLVLFIQWLERGESKKLLLLLTLSVLFSNAYTHPGFLVAFWFPAALYAAIRVFRRGKHTLFRCFTALILWTLVNVWWIYPFVSNLSSTYGRYSAVDSSYETLQGVSVAFPISQILLLKQKYYFDSTYNPQVPTTSWGTWYENPVILLISFLIFAFVLFGWWKFRSNKTWIFLSLLAIAGIFVSKGTNFPFGSVFYKVLFNNFPIFQVLRNPYEKFGVVWLLPFALFFGTGMTYAYKRIAKRVAGKLLFVCITLLIFGLLVWPIWNRKLFEDYSFVNVPIYYRQLNNYLNDDPEDFRVLSLPTIPDHGVALTWGYRGDEPSVFLFDKTFVSKRIKYPFYTEKYDQLRTTTDNGIIDTELFNELNIKYIVLNRDIRWDTVGAAPIDSIENALNANKALIDLGNFGNLRLYKRVNFNGSLISLEGDNLPIYSYKNIGVNKFEVNVMDAKEPFILVLKNNYNDQWASKIDEQILKDHFLIYNYANAWKVNKKGDYTIKLVFRVWPWEWFFRH
ncbi:hypothetical protein A2955_01015 [Candidatus Woesebacteria bacterium RIFCSPLOWO2_01_FULL_37_19]|uniref:Alpha-(1->3)-arabinofuranosyltransferase N-terminal GT-C domain-containing protein n=1 Tax=Candidatus Woesebacteria bacterium RIFCSPLOWO2_01_FULL_37_19 TaxID=1802514 RepID=A0A1F8B877_9BACT|nr:MAG: hypothetical protein A2955_01015 [Candidatus Woesebacteria bacterium RIFCSPLOWO2_01_FULL_37_19]